MPHHVGVIIDRLTPTRRPAMKPVGLQSWRSLLFLHWPVPVSALRLLVPQALDIDTHEDVAYVGLVPFAMSDVRTVWMPSALGLRFLETNVRTYVHVGGRDPGVYFFSLEAASWLAVQVARAQFGLPYFYASMSQERSGTAVSYRSVRRGQPDARLSVEYEIGGWLGPSAPATLEHFLFERYLLHVERGGRLMTGQVHHAPYPAQLASVRTLDEGLTAAAGIAVPPGLPPLAHWAAGVDVEIYPLRPARTPSTSAGQR
ncbi:MAG: DUF2071 domain-containing protein [Chloroflexota bacterium]